MVQEKCFFNRELENSCFQSKESFFIKSGQRIVNIGLPELFQKAEVLDVDFRIGQTTHTVQIQPVNDPSFFHFSVDPDGCFLILKPSSESLDLQRKERVV